MDPRRRYPALSEEHEARWGTALMRLRYEHGMPPEALISNVRMIAFVGERVVVVHTREFGATPFPGGTLDEGEAWRDGVARELREEAGARVLSYTPFGGVRIVSDRAEPYRAHLPHPVFYWLVGYGEVELDGEPTQPPGGEVVERVDLCEPNDALALIPDAVAWWGDLLRLAVDLRSGDG